MNYRDSGVNINVASDFIANLTTKITSTYDSNVILSNNNFCGLYDISKINLKHPILASSTDGVGSKIKLASHYKAYHEIGMDVVFNNTNDIICSGATPLFFLDYYGVGKLNPDVGNIIMSGIIDACKLVDIPLIGGETAELPLTYSNGDFDLVGTCVGFVNKDEMFVPENADIGDVLIGLKSSGPHSNGYTLINKILEQVQPTEDVIHNLLKSTVNYHDWIMKLHDYGIIKSCANITGGGLNDNVARILPNNLSAIIDRSRIDVPEIFNWIQKSGNVDYDEMWRVFNMGIGMVVCIAADDVEQALSILPESATILGSLIKRVNNKSVIFV